MIVTRVTFCNHNCLLTILRLFVTLGLRMYIFLGYFCYLSIITPLYTLLLPTGSSLLVCIS